MSLFEMLIRGMTKYHLIKGCDTQEDFKPENEANIFETRQVHNDNIIQHGVDVDLKKISSADLCNLL